MAKSNMAKLVELHLEKVVLGLCVVLLAFAVAHWTVSSPREFKPATGGQALAPSQADGYLGERAAALAERARQTTVPDEIARRHANQVDPEWDKVISDGRQFRAAVIDKPSLGEPMYAKVKPAGPPPPHDIAMEEFVNIIPAPGAPRVVSDTVLARIDKPADVAINGVTAAYPFKQLVDNWKKLESTVAKVPMRVDIEVEETAADGTVTVKPLDPFGLKSGPKSEKKDLVPLPVIPDFLPGKNQAAVFVKINEYNAEACQRRILTPDLPDIWDVARGSWISGAIVLRSILPEGLLVIPGVKINQPAPEPKSSLTPTPAPTATTPPKPPTVTPPKPPTATPPKPPTATPPRPPAPAVAKPAVGAGNAPTVQVVVQSSRDAESIYLWCLQANVKPGSTYRYRVRLTFINPLLGRDTLAKHIEESKVKTVESPWSAWSEPVTVVRPIRFFLVNKVTEGQVRVAVFAHAMGRWVRRDYTVAQGDPIGHAEPQQKVLNPLTGKEQEMPVDFSTGTVAMDFSETSVVLPTGRAVVGVEMIYLDEDGRLKAQTNVMADRAAPAAKEYDALYKQSQPEPKRPGMGGGGQ